MGIRELIMSFAPGTHRYETSQRIQQQYEQALREFQGALGSHRDQIILAYGSPDPIQLAQHTTATSGVVTERTRVIASHMGDYQVQLSRYTVGRHPAGAETKTTMQVEVIHIDPQYVERPALFAFGQIDFVQANTTIESIQDHLFEHVNDLQLVISDGLESDTRMLQHFTQSLGQS